MSTAYAGPVTNYLSSMSPNVPQTPEMMLQAADSLANELLGLPESVKDSELRKLQQQNKVLHALVKERMNVMRRQTRSAAGNAAVGMMQQQGG